MSELPAPARSVTRTVTIDRPARDVHAFLSDAANWPRWAVVNVLAAEPADEPDGGESGRPTARGRFAFVRTPRRGFLITTSETRTSRDGWQRCRRGWSRTAAVLTS